MSFGLGSYEAIDVIRITWPNGLIQNETQQPTGLAFNYEEKERLSGSCPTLFTWNGQEFEFITDMLGAAALGLRVGEDEYFAAGSHLHLLENATASSNHWLQASLTGVRNLSTAPGAKVEVRAGSLYQKKTYRGIPLSFGLGSYEAIDVIRITWPNGLIQNETQQPTGLAFNYEEKERLSGSCPTLFTWNGQEFEFITDMLGAAALGLRVGEDEYFAADHDEYIQIPSGSLARIGQHYEIRITEELREVAYLDQLRLIAVDHPLEVDFFTNDKLKATPLPEWHLFGVKERLYPLWAQDQRGRDVLSRIVKLDRSYPDDIDRFIRSLCPSAWDLMKRSMSSVLPGPTA